MNEKLKEKLYFFWSSAIVLCVALAFFSLIFASCADIRDTGDTSPADVIEPAQADE